MKKLLFLLTGLLMCLSVNAQNNNIVSEFQKKFGKDIKFTTVNISPKMFEMIAMMAEDDGSSEMAFLRNLTGLKMITTSNPDPKFIDHAYGLITKSGMEELMSVQDEADNVYMYIKENKGKISELVIAVQDTTEFLLLTITGNIDLKEIKKLSGSVSGLEKLEGLDF